MDIKGKTLNQLVILNLLHFKVLYSCTWESVPVLNLFFDHANMQIPFPQPKIVFSKYNCFKMKIYNLKKIGSRDS